MSELQVHQAALRDDLTSFIHQCFLTVVPGVSYMHNWHIEALAYHLEQATDGRIKRLLITIPPRYLKSISASVALVAWLLGHDPTKRIVCVSYSQELAEKHARDTRMIMNSPWYRALFPRTRFDPNHCPLHELTTTEGGYRLSTSVGGTLTGRGGNIIIIDDPHKAQEMESDAARKTVWDWYRTALLSRLDNKTTDPIIVIQQRLHEEDLAGHLLESGDWVHLNLPAIAEQDEDIPISEDYVWPREEGDLLHPEREDQPALDEMKTNMGSMVFAAQYQQRPAPKDGEIVKKSWFKTYDRPPESLANDFLLQSWDTAQTVTTEADYSVCTTWLIRDDNFYLLDVERFKAQFPELKHRVIQSGRRHNPNLIVIEAIGAGGALYQQVRAELGSCVRFHKPTVDKKTRMWQESPLIEAGYVYLPNEAPWLADFMHEMINFPNGKHDDQVDSVSQFLWWARTCRRRWPQAETRVTVISAEPDLNYHLRDLW